MIKSSRECVINVPTYDLAAEVVGIGNCSGATVDKFKAFADGGRRRSPSTRR